MKELSKVLAALAQPFPYEDVDIKVQSETKDRRRGMVVAYVDVRSVIERLNEVLEGQWNDTYEILHTKEVEARDRAYTEYNVACTLSTPSHGFGPHTDVGTSDSLKGAFSDALKRVAVKLGVGSYLYSLPRVWADLGDDRKIINPEAIKREILSGKQAADASPPRSIHRQNTEERPAPSAPSSASLKKQGASEGSNSMTDLQRAAIVKRVKQLAEQEQEDYGEEFLTSTISLALEQDVTLNMLTKTQASEVITWLNNELAS